MASRHQCFEMPPAQGLKRFVDHDLYSKSARCAFKADRMALLSADERQQRVWPSIWCMRSNTCRTVTDRRRRLPSYAR